LCGFVRSQKFKSVRFWGKILGKQADYYVMETTRAGAGEDAEPVDGETAEDTKEVPDEKEGEGCNFFVYYVCSYGELRRPPAASDRFCLGAETASPPPPVYTLAGPASS
jgi:hypothetical protein